MGIIDKVKRRLPIVGEGGNVHEAPAPRAAAPARTWEPEPASARGGAPVREFIDGLVKSNSIVLFMKGSPDQPMCGFSANAAGILKSYGKPLAHFDVLSDEEVRQGIKEYSDWPTLPQVYIGGEFLGGSDILTQAHQSGELKEMIDQAFAPKG